MIPLRKLLLVLVAQCVLTAIVRGDCLNLLDECTDDDGDTKVCELRCGAEPCGVDQSVGDDCSKSNGRAKECQELCNTDDPPVCKLVCKPTGAAGAAKKAAKKKKAPKKKKAIKKRAATKKKAAPKKK